MRNALFIIIFLLLIDVSISIAQENKQLNKIPAIFMSFEHQLYDKYTNLRQGHNINQYHMAGSSISLNYNLIQGLGIVFKYHNDIIKEEFNVSSQFNILSETELHNYMGGISLYNEGWPVYTNLLIGINRHVYDFEGGIDFFPADKNLVIESTFNYAQDFKNFFVDPVVYIGIRRVFDKEELGNIRIFFGFGLKIF